MRKFALALEYGSTVSDLQEIKEQIKELTDLLSLKEQAETVGIIADISPQSNMSATA
jgi:DNA-directed RNA polymerase subunit F